MWCGIFIYNHVYCNAVSQCVDESMEQDDSFFDVANLKIIINGICVHFIQCLSRLIRLNLC